MRKPRNIIMRISSILALLLAFVAGRPVAAEEKPNFAIALCNWVGGAEVTEKVRGIYYNACICNEVDRTISRTGSAGNLWAEAEKLEGTFPIICTERKSADDKITYENTTVQFQKYRLTGQVADVKCYKRGTPEQAELCGADGSFDFYASINATAGSLAWSGSAKAELKIDVGAAYGPVRPERDGDKVKVVELTDRKWKSGLFEFDPDHTAGAKPPVYFVQGTGQGNYFQYSGFAASFHADAQAKLAKVYGSVDLNVRVFCFNRAINVGYTSITAVTRERECGGGGED